MYLRHRESWKEEKGNVPSYLLEFKEKLPPKTTKPLQRKQIVKRKKKIELIFS